MSADERGRQLVRLDEAECWRRAGAHTVGRFAANRHRASPLVVPVNYLIEGSPPQVILRSGAGTKLSSVQRELVALQVDEIDPTHHAGWSVQIEGTARWLYYEQDPAIGDPWAPGDRPYVIRITPTRVTGMEIQLGTPDTDGRGYR